MLELINKLALYSWSNYLKLIYNTQPFIILQAIIPLLTLNWTKPDYICGRCPYAPWRGKLIVQRSLIDTGYWLQWFLLSINLVYGLPWSRWRALSCLLTSLCA